MHCQNCRGRGVILQVVTANPIGITAMSEWRLPPPKPALTVSELPCPDCTVVMLGFDEEPR